MRPVQMRLLLDDDKNARNHRMYPGQKRVLESPEMGIGSQRADGGFQEDVSYQVKGHKERTCCPNACDRLDMGQTCAIYHQFFKPHFFQGPKK